MKRGRVLANSTFLVALLFPWLFFSSFAQTSAVITSPVNGHRYQMLSSNTWSQSRAAAIGRGGWLATVRTQAEQDWIYETFGNFGGTPRALWIGLNDQSTEGSFAWMNNEPITFTHWAGGAPANSGSADYVLVHPPGHAAAGSWAVDFDLPPTVRPHGIIEYAAVPWISPDLDWTFCPNSSGTRANDVAVGRHGETYVAGFCRTNNFGTTNLISAGGSDALLCRLDPQGTVVWAQLIGGIGNDIGTSVAVDTNGFIYVAGTFQQNASIAHTNITVANNGNGMFLAKFDTNGVLSWIVGGGGTNNPSPTRIAIDSANNIHVVGTFQNTVTLQQTNLTSAGGSDVFLAKYDSDGVLLWATTGGGPGDDFGYRVATRPSGESYIIGSFISSMATFGAITLTNAGGRDVFIATYDSAGNPMWARRDGGTQDEWGNGIAVDTDGTVFAAGFFRGTAVFGGTHLTNTSGFFPQSWDIFLARYTSAGEPVWAKREGNSVYSELANDLCLDELGSLHMVFTYYGNTIIDGVTVLGAGGETTTDIGIAKYSRLGTAEWVKSIDYSFQDDGLALDVNPAGGVHFAGVTSSQFLTGRVQPNLPHLFIERAPANVWILWPTNFTGFQLEYATELPAGAWNGIQNVAVSNGWFKAIQPATQGASFYRLRQTSPPVSP